MTEQIKTGLDLIKEQARIARSGVVFDRSSIETGVPRTIELLEHLPEDLRTAILEGRTRITVDYMGNSKQE